MSDPGLIRDYLAALAEQLPAPLVDELADGLDQTYRRYLRQGLGPDAAAGAAVAEFSELRIIAAAFNRVSPARRAARRLLAAGPVAGGCWGAALITGRAWTWPVPAATGLLLGAALVVVGGLLALAAFGGRYPASPPRRNRRLHRHHRARRHHAHRRDARRPASDRADHPGTRR